MDHSWEVPKLVTSKRSIAIIITLSLIGFIALLAMTRWGIGTSPDFVVYIGAARNLLDGKGLSVPFGRFIDSPLTQYPPLYPMALALPETLGIDPLDGARWLNAILFGLLISLVGFSIRQITNKANWIPLVGALLILSSVVMLGIHTYAWTEPLFILLSFGGLVILAAYLETSKLVYLLGTSVAIGLAALTRFVGVTVIATGCLGILLLLNGNFLKKIKDTIIFGAISFLPLFLWLVRNTVTTNSIASREFAFHPITRNHFFQALQTVSTWFLVPAAAPGLLKVLILVSIFMGILVIVYLQQRNLNLNQVDSLDKRDQKTHPFIKLILIFVLTYSGFLLFSISFLDANTPLDDRILSPIFTALIILLAYFTHQLFLLTHHKPAIKIPIVLVVLFFSTTYLFMGMNLSIRSYDQGLGFSSLQWRNSELVDQINELPATVTIHSNAPYAVYALTGRPALSLPKKFLSMNQRVNDNFAVDMANIGAEINKNGGVIVFFDLFSRDPLEMKGEIEDTLSLKVISETTIGTIYGSEIQK